MHRMGYIYVDKLRRIFPETDIVLFNPKARKNQLHQH